MIISKNRLRPFVVWEHHPKYSVGFASSDQNSGHRKVKQDKILVTVRSTEYSVKIRLSYKYENRFDPSCIRQLAASLPFPYSAASFRNALIFLQATGLFLQTKWMWKSISDFQVVLAVGL